MALNATEQKLLDFAMAMLPTWFTSSERELEFLNAAAKALGSTQAQMADWFKNTLITTAVGPTASDPDWLGQHATDRGTGRQAGETDVALRQRLRSIEDALTRATLLAAAQAIVTADGVVGTVEMVELPRDLAFFGVTAASDAGVAGEFTAPDGANVQRFTPAGSFVGVPFRAIEEAVTHKLTTTGAAAGGNDVTDAVITGLDGDAITFTNATGAATSDPAVAWTVQRYDRDGNLLDGFSDSYFSRGDRMGRLTTVILILPFGSTAGTAASVLEMLRQKGGAGVRGLVEYRQIP